MSTRGTWRASGALVIALVAAATVGPSTAVAGTSFNIQMPTFGDMTVGVVEVEVEPPPTQGDRLELIRGLTLQPTGVKLPPPVLSSFAVRTAGEVMRVTALLAVTRPQGARVSGGSFKSLAFELGTGGSVATGLGRSIQELREEKQKLEQELDAARLERQRLEQQMRVASGKELAQLQAEMSRLIAQIREFLDALKEAEQQAMRNVARGATSKPLAIGARRAKVGAGDVKVVGKIKLAQSKNALDNLEKTAKVLAKTKSAKKLIKKLDDKGYEKRIDERAFRKALLQAFAGPVQKREDAIEKLKLSLESKACVKGTLLWLCEQPKSDQKPKPIPLVPPLPQPAPVPPPPPGETLVPAAPKLLVDMMHTPSGVNCVDVSTDPPQPGAAGTYFWQAEAFPPLTAGFQLDGQGRKRIVFGESHSSHNVRTAIAVELPGGEVLEWEHEGAGGVGYGREVAEAECPVDIS
ncbi:MAG TPA: hypothetical protein VHF90_04980 [Thermoleophilaceae bacterium]|nr:hypothetical protein [Thermoleophilaceae bacterium]